MKTDNFIKRHALSAAIISAVLVLIVDINTSLGYAEWILYLLPILLVSYGRRTNNIYIMLCISAVLIVMGLLLSPPGGISFARSVINRSLAILVYWIIALLLVWGKRKEDVLTESEQKYRRLQEYLQMQIDRMPIGLIIWDKDFRVKQWNPAATKIFGFTEEEALGKHPYDLIVPKEAQPAVDRIWARLLEGDFAAYSVNENTTRDGRTIICDWSNTPLKGADGLTTSVLSMVQDITERRKAEDRVRLIADEWQKTFDATADLIMVLDPNYRIVRANKPFSRFLNMTVDKIVGRHCYELMHGTDFPLPECPLYRLKMSHKREEFELYLKEKNVWAEVTVDPVFDEQGNLTEVIHIIRDITGRKKTEEELEKHHEHLEELVKDRTAELEQANARLKELDSMKSMFIASVSHELRTPLTAILGFSSMLEEEWSGPLNPKQKEYTDMVLQSGRHLLNLINDLIDISKLEAGTAIEPRLADFDLYDLMSEAVNLVTKSAGDRGLEIKFKPVHLQMHTDRQRLLQCVINLLSNAVKFTEKGSVTLETEIVCQNDEDMIEISVSDTGIGIREEDMPRLFKPFSRLENTNEAVSPGTGLGLYLTKRLIEGVLKGDIIYVGRYGEGSRFTIRIPVSLDIQKSLGEAR